ncbi:ARM repeat-containing protein [Martensiomyces pterosporus]|nr:ARM repeat-containing protein [Martensiomyces pterosporus]
MARMDSTANGSRSKAKSKGPDGKPGKFGNKQTPSKGKHSKESHQAAKQEKAEGQGSKRKAFEQPAIGSTPQESRQLQKKQRLERQMAQPDGGLKVAARKLWEQLRRRDLDEKVRKEKMKEMMALIRGKIKDVTFKHDMSRVIQTCIKYGSDEQRAEIAEELMGGYLELSRSLYGRYILMRMLKHCPKYRGEIIKAFYGNVRKLVRHKEASVVIEECYAVYANAGQRWNLVAEFYGNEFAIFKDQPAAGDSPKSLEAVLEKAPQKKETILNTLKTTLTPLLEKGTIQHSIVHRALLDYIKHAEPKERLEIVETMRELVVEILHTRDGAQAGMLCLLYGTPKDRKAIVKSFKPFLQRICCEEYGYAVLIQALDCMDDTVFMNKTIVQDLCAIANELIEDRFGRRVLLYILAGRNPQYVGIDALKVLNEGDPVREETSKKDPTTRHSELAAHISEKMIKWVAGHLQEAIFDPLPSQAVSETLLRAQGDKSEAWAAVLELVKADIEESGESHVLVNPISNRVITNCIIAEYAQPKTSDKTLPEVPKENPKFGSDILDALVEAKQLKSAAVAGAFPVRALLDSPVTSKKAKKLVKPFRDDIKKAMKGAEKKRVFEAMLSHLE